MKVILLLLAALQFSTGEVRGANCTLPADYKRKIEGILAASHPQYAEFYCEYYEPKRVLMGESMKERCAVRCDWGAKLKSGAIPLMITRGIFLYDGKEISEVNRGEKVEWIDGEPVKEGKQPNHPAEPNSPSRGGSS